MSERYRTIVADPPWDIDWKPGSAKIKGGAWWADGKREQKQGRDMAYATMSMDQIAALDVDSFAEDDCILFLWATRKVFREGDAARIARAWGFEPFAEIIWGLRSPGLGHPATRNDHEPCLLARRGAAVLTAEVPLGVYFWRQVYGHSGRAPYKIHSAKSEGFFDFVEQVSPGPFLEMFARRQRLGWDTWGDEAFGHVALAGDAEKRPEPPLPEPDRPRRH